MPSLCRIRNSAYEFDENADTYLTEIFERLKNKNLA